MCEFLPLLQGGNPMEQDLERRPQHRITKYRRKCDYHGQKLRSLALAPSLSTSSLGSAWTVELRLSDVPGLSDNVR